jgi:long-chain acyl-CoA synthetase
MSENDYVWLRSWPAQVPRMLKYPDVPLHEILRKVASEQGKKTAISFCNANTNYAELNEASDKFAASLSRLGVTKGDRIAIYLPNIPPFIISYFGVMKAGGVVTAISPLHRERELKHQLCDSGAEIIVTIDSLYPIAANVWDKTRLRMAVITNIGDSSAKLSEKRNVYPYHQMMDISDDAPKLKFTPAEDLAALQYTGGTTGIAKGAMLTHRNLVANAVAFATWIASTAKDTFLTALPLFHIYGMTTSMNAPISIAAKMVLLPRFDAENTLKAIQQHKATVFCGVPTMYASLLAQPNLNGYNLTSIRVCISGASPLPFAVQKRFMEITGGLLAEGYGLTEASPVTHCTPVDNKKKLRVGSIGFPLPDTDACILDLETSTRRVKPGELGELSVRGPQVMKGYWNNQQETILVLRDGWLLTGDIARIDDEGYFYICDRKKDLIKYKDYSVYPRELEDLLYEHPAVQLCAVIGKPDFTVGEIPKAFVVLKKNFKVTEKEIVEFVKERVASYKWIREVEFREDLPVSSAGKVLRRVLQEQERNKLLRK